MGSQALREGNGGDLVRGGVGRINDPGGSIGALRRAERVRSEPGVDPIGDGLKSSGAADLSIVHELGD